MAKTTNFRWLDKSVKTASSNKDIDKDDIKAQKRARYRQDTHFRRWLSIWVMVIVPCWLLLVMILMYFTGFGLTSFSDTSIVALLSTTTVNVLGLAFIVLRGMFPQRLLNKESVKK